MTGTAAPNFRFGLFLLWSRPPFTPTVRDHFALAVNIFENLRDHRRRHRAAVCLYSHITLVKRGEGILRIVRRQITGKPRRRALLVLRSPLRGAGFARDFDIVQARRVRSSRRPIDRVDHSRAQLRHGRRGNIERAFFAHVVGADDLAVDRLHLLDETGLIKCAAVRHDRPSPAPFAAA